MNVGAWFARRPPLSPEARERLAREVAAVSARQQREQAKDLAAEAQREREREEAALDAERREASAEEIRESCRRVGHWFPGDVVVENRLAGGTSWRSRVVARIFSGWAR